MKRILLALALGALSFQAIKADVAFDPSRVLSTIGDQINTIKNNVQTLVANATAQLEKGDVPSGVLLQQSIEAAKMAANDAARLAQQFAQTPEFHALVQKALDTAKNAANLADDQINKSGNPYLIGGLDAVKAAKDAALSDTAKSVLTAAQTVHSHLGDVVTKLQANAPEQVKPYLNSLNDVHEGLGKALDLSGQLLDKAREQQGKEAAQGAVKAASRGAEVPYGPDAVAASAHSAGR